MEPNRFEQNTTLRILQAADQGGYGVIAVTGYTLEQVLGFVKAAERKKSPLIIQFSPWAIAYSNGVLVHAAAQAVRRTSVPIALHLSQCIDEDMEGHLAKTKELAAYCHAHGKAAVVEPWSSDGEGNNMWDNLDAFAQITSPQEAWEFVDAGVDLVVLAGFEPPGEFTPRGQAFGFRNAELIRRWIGTIPGTYDPNEGVLQSITAGIRKIDVSTHLLIGHYGLLEQRVGQIPFTQVVDEAIETVIRPLADEMDVVGSTGRA